MSVDMNEGSGEGSGNVGVMCPPDDCEKGLSILAIYGIGAAVIVIIAITTLAVIIGARRVSKKWKGTVDLCDDEGYLFLKPPPSNQIELKTIISSGSDQPVHSSLAVSTQLSCSAVVIIPNETTPPTTPPTSATSPSEESVETIPSQTEETLQEEVRVVSASELTPLSGAPKRKRARSDYDHLVNFSSPSRAVVIISSGSMSSQPLIPKKEEEEEEEVKEKEEKGEEGREEETDKEKLPEKDPGLATARIGQPLVTTMLSSPNDASSDTYDHIPLNSSSSLPVSRAEPSQAGKSSHYLHILPDDDTYAIPDDPPSNSGASRNSHIYSTIDEPLEPTDPGFEDDVLPVAAVSDDTSKDYSYAATHTLSPPDGEKERGTFTEGENPHHYSLMSDDMYYIHHLLQPPAGEGAARKEAEVGEEEENSSHRRKKSLLSSSSQRASYLLILPPPRFSRSFSSPNIGSVALASSHSEDDNGRSSSYDDLTLAVFHSGGHRYYNLPKIPQDYEVPIPHTDGKCTAPLRKHEIPPPLTPPVTTPKMNKSRTLPDHLRSQFQPSLPHKGESLYTSLISREVRKKSYYAHLSPSLSKQPHQQRASTTSKVYENQSELWRSMRFQRPFALSVATKRYTPLVHRIMLDEDDYALPIP